MKHQDCSQFCSCETGSFKISKQNLGIAQGMYQGSALYFRLSGDVFVCLACCSFFLRRGVSVSFSRVLDFWDGNYALNKVGR